MIKMSIALVGGIFGGAAVLAGFAYAGYKLYKRYDRAKAEKLAIKKAKEEFAASAFAFSGLYEPLYMMAKGSSRYRAGVLGDWAARTANLAGADYYRGMWDSRFPDFSGWDKEKGFAKTSELLSFVLACGVCRDNSSQITVGSDTYRKYVSSEDEIIEAGNPAKVKNAYWFIGDKVLEKGMIEKI